MQAVSTLNNTDQMLAVAGDALVSVEAVHIGTQPADVTTGRECDERRNNAACLRGMNVPHFEPGLYAARDRMPLAEAIKLLQHPPPGWHTSATNQRTPPPLPAATAPAARGDRTLRCFVCSCCG